MRKLPTSSGSPPYAMRFSSTKSLRSIPVALQIEIISSAGSFLFPLSDLEIVFTGIPVLFEIKVYVIPLSSKNLNVTQKILLQSSTCSLLW